MSILGGFVPLVLHHGTSHPGSIDAAHAAAKTLSDAGGQYFVAAIISSMESWDRPTLDDTEWSNLFDGIDETEKVAAEYGLTQVVHPHVNTLIETDDEFERFLKSSPAPFCLDTGHLFIGDADPVAIAEAARRPCRPRSRQGRRQVDRGPIPGGRVRLDGSHPARVCSHLRVRAMRRSLLRFERSKQSGYAGWYVLEQDVALTDGEPPLGEGPVHGVRKSIEYLKSLAG